MRNIMSAEIEALTCSCDPKSFYNVDCDIHVNCDDRCKALKDPKTLEEVTLALEHWRDHGLMSGCAHGR